MCGGVKLDSEHFNESAAQETALGLPVYCSISNMREAVCPVSKGPPPSLKIISIREERAHPPLMPFYFFELFGLF